MHNHFIFNKKWFGRILNMTSFLSLLGIAALACFGGFLTGSWVTGITVFAVLAVAAATAGDLDLSAFKRKT